MLKKYLNAAFTYAILAIASGVFDREFTKLFNFVGKKTVLNVVHTHYFVLGMFFFLIVLALEKAFAFSDQKLASSFYTLYTIGLNGAAVMMTLRGILIVLGTPLSFGINLTISIVAGICHLILTIGLVQFFLAMKKQLASGK